MNPPILCRPVHADIDAFGASGTLLSAWSLAHLDECELCRHRHADAQLQRLVQCMVVPPMRAGFADSAIRCAIEHGLAAGVDKRRGSGTFAALAASVALLALVFGALTITHRSSVRTDGVVAQVAMAPRQSKMVSVVIDSARHRNNATITISLAENLELEGFPDDRVVEWDTQLMQGKNLLALPLRVKYGNGSHFDVAFSDGPTRQQVRVEIALIDPPPLA